MDSLVFWQILGFSCIVFMFYMYSILDGFDLGAGILIYFVTENDEGRMTILGSILPFWDGNEVWLVLAVSTFFAAFPAAYSRLLPAFYLPVIFVISCFIIRAVSLELSYSGKTRSRLPLPVFAVSSFVAAYSGILFLAFIVSGVPVNENGIFTLDVKCLLKPLPLVLSAAWLILMLMHSVSYLVRKSYGSLKARLLIVARTLWPVFLVLFAVSIVLLFMKMPAIRARPMVWIGLKATLSGAGLYRFSLSREKEKRMFAFSSISMGGVWIVVSAAMFPNIISPPGDAAAAMTLFDSSAPLSTLRIVVLSSLVAMAAIIAYTFFVYRIFRNRGGSATY